MDTVGRFSREFITDVNTRYHDAVVASYDTRLEQLRDNQAIMQMVFGGEGGQSALFTTQLLSAFGPGDDAGDTGDKSSLTKAFGAGGDSALT